MKVVQEAFPLADAGTVRVLDLALDAFAGPVHAHPVIELTWILQGTGLRLVGDSVEPYGPGDLVLVAPHAAHAWWTGGPQPGAAVAQVMQLHPSAALQALPEWGPGIGELLNEPASAWVLGGALAAGVTARMHDLVHARGLEQLATGLALLARIADAGAAADRRAVGLRAPRTGPATGRAQSRIEGLLTWVHDHLDEDITAAAAARQLHVTPAAFSRTFKRLVGRPFTDYVNDARIAEARLLLRRGDRPVTEIAAACGFPTLSNFNAQFRRRTGLSPREYRKAPSGGR